MQNAKDAIQKTNSTAVEQVASTELTMEKDERKSEQNHIVNSLSQKTTSNKEESPNKVLESVEEKEEVPASAITAIKEGVTPAVVKVEAETRVEVKADAAKEEVKEDDEQPRQVESIEVTEMSMTKKLDFNQNIDVNAGEIPQKIEEESFTSSKMEQQINAYEENGQEDKSHEDQESADKVDDLPEIDNTYKFEPVDEDATWRTLKNARQEEEQEDVEAQRIEEKRLATERKALQEFKNVEEVQIETCKHDEEKATQQVAEQDDAMVD